jgi:hypothetical protein
VEPRGKFLGFALNIVLVSSIMKKLEDKQRER